MVAGPAGNGGIPLKNGVCKKMASAEYPNPDADPNLRTIRYCGTKYQGSKKYSAAGAVDCGACVAPGTIPKPRHDAGDDGWKRIEGKISTVPLLEFSGLRMQKEYDSLAEAK